MIPKQKITVTHDSEDIDFSDLTLAMDIWLRENKGSNANITPTNKDATVYLNQIEQDDIVRISLKRDTTDDWTKVFGGYAVELSPQASVSTGLILPTKCYGFDIAFDRMRVAHEYGVGSVRPDLQTVYGILLDNTAGILPKYFSYVLATGLSSGYSCETTYMYDDTTTTLPYMIYPYVPINDTLKSLLDLYTAQHGTGLHWTVLQPAGDGAMQFCLDQVNNHTTAASRWATNCPVTITPGENIQSTVLTKQQQEANYLVYFGKYEYPIDESLTEDATGDWTDFIGSAFFTASDDTSDPKVGANSFKLSATSAGAFVGMWYHALPSLDTSKFGTRRTSPTLGFYMKQNGVTTVKIRLGTGSVGTPTTPTNCFIKNLSSQIPKSGEWGWVTTDIGFPFKPNEWTVEAGTPDWTDLDYIMVWFEGNVIGTSYLKLDGMAIDGIITRVAYQTGANHYKIKLITDSLARTANLTASDDSGTVAQLCKADYLRAKTTPIIGTIMLSSLYPTILPGQIIQTMNLRITEVRHHIEATNAYTSLEITDDLLNSYPQENLSFGPTAQYNALMKAVNPDFQDRDRGTLKAREIDIDQQILAKGYA
jgi:hypothetical protein